ncbi:MAG: hypothetical protein WA021_02470 [Minisyncoccia bacterium]
MTERAKEDGGAAGPFVTPRYMASPEGHNAMKNAARSAIDVRGERRVKWILVLGVLLPLLAGTAILVVTNLR